MNIASLRKTGPVALLQGNDVRQPNNLASLFF